jgi:predicted nucleic acid-binding protein
MRGSLRDCARYRGGMKRADVPEPLLLPFPDDDLVEVAAWVRGITTAAQCSGLAVMDTRADFAASPPTLYVETSVVSYATARPSLELLTARRQALTREWWHTHRTRHVSFVSELVRGEVGNGDADAARRRLELISTVASVHSSQQTHELAARILAQCNLPARVYDDAHHVALAAIHGLEILLTWNCAHLANPHMIPHIRRACEAYGCAAPDIYTPEKLIGVCAYGRSDS